MHSRTRSLLPLLFCLLAIPFAVAGKPPADDAKRIKSEIAQMMALFEKGDAQALLDLTHESAYVLVGGNKEAFDKAMKQAAEQVFRSGIKFLSSEIGDPTEIHSAGKYEVCFVPRISVLEYQGKKIKSTGFLIAARTAGQRDWKYLDGAALRQNPGLLNKLFPDLAPDVPLPPNNRELL